MKGIYLFKLLSLFLYICISVSCNKKKDGIQIKNLNTQNNTLLKDETKSDNFRISEQDTIYNYWELKYDTITYQTDLKVLNKIYTLQLKTFSLNDSTIVRKLDEKYIDHSHTIVTDIKITYDSVVVKKRIDKTNFKEYLIPEFYADCNLLQTEYESILKNKIYLISILSVPDTDNQWQIKYSLPLNENIDSLTIKEVKYIGN